MTRPTGGLLFPRSADSAGLVPAGGATGQVLTKSSGTDYDAAWQTPAGSGGGRTLIASNVLAAMAASVTFSSIPGTYSDLLLQIIGRGTQSATSVAVRIRFNGDTGSNYDYSRENRFGSTQGAAAAFIEIGSIAAATAPASTPSDLEISIPRYADTAWHHSAYCDQFLKTGTTGAAMFMQHSGGIWRSGAAITSITALLDLGNYDVGSAFYLYGI